ncbi:hypothetical protein EON63_14225 [archaeon]|nr:MAG: hypothetical protein EON63_14225 [archaeon]
MLSNCSNNSILFSSISEDYKAGTVPPDKFATNENQLASIAELPNTTKYPLYEEVCFTGKLDNYFKVSCYPITKKAEDDLELLSDIVTWGEKYLHHWELGTYRCAQCQHPLYSSLDKYKGPCVWPSFRGPARADSLHIRKVYPYNKYTVSVYEVYCNKCKLFIGHQFDDARDKGDVHPGARWRH